MFRSTSSRFGAISAVITSLVLLGCSFGALSGPLVVGAGDVRTETRQVADFTRVDATGGLQLQLNIGSPTTVQVTAQDNLLPITTTTVADGRLTVRTSQPFSTSAGIKILVTLPTLSEISVSAGSVGVAEGLAAADLRVNADAGAVLTLTGTAQVLTLSQNAGAVLNGTNFTATNATVQLSSGAIATVAVTGSVTGSADSGAMLNLRGSPTNVNVTTSAGALVNR